MLWQTVSPEQVHDVLLAVCCQ